MKEKKRKRNRGTLSGSVSPALSKEGVTKISLIQIVEGYKERRSTKPLEMPTSLRKKRTDKN